MSLNVCQLYHICRDVRLSPIVIKEEKNISRLASIVLIISLLMAEQIGKN